MGILSLYMSKKRSLGACSFLSYYMRGAMGGPPNTVYVKNRRSNTVVKIVKKSKIDIFYYFLILKARACCAGEW